MTLPTLLAGPIVRRVERDAVSVWVAVNADLPINLKIWSGLRPASVADSPLGETTLDHPTKLGANLWIAVVTLKLAGAQILLNSGQVYSYDLKIGNKTLKDLDLLKKTDAQGDPKDLDYKPAGLPLGYGTNQLPSFVTPQESLDRVNIAHGSCRRPHGPSHDAIAALDKVLGGSLPEADKRPQQLFLTGDQIYADDVALPLLPMLNRLGKVLFGIDERLVKANGSSVAVSAEALPTGRRTALCKEEAKFTSTSASSHILSLAEYSAMYLCAFSPAVWGTLESEAKVFTAGSASADNGVPLNGLKEDLRIAYRKHLRDVIAFRQSVPAARRALANVATYMIFDDHEVTDDWNLTRKWRRDVLASPTGKQILRNGHVAYAFFQAWGNDPAAFAKGANKALLDESSKLVAANGRHTPARAEKIDTLLRHGLPLTAQETTEEDKHRVKWHYTLKCPNYDVAVLDTRTVREFTGDFTPPDLVGKHLDKQVKGDKNKSFLLLISAAPVLSPPLIDRIAQPIGAPIVDLLEPKTRTEFTGVGATTLDVEGWGGDEYAQERLLKKLAPFKRVLILSGDVHYGYSMTLDYWRRGQDKADRIVQLVSSGTHNEFHKIVRAFNRASMLLSEVVGIGLSGERLAWDSNDEPVTFPPNIHLNPARRERLRREPVIVPAHGWPAGTTLNAQNEPNWRWRLKLVYDNRPDDKRPSGPGMPLLGDDITFEDPIADYFRIASLHNGHSAQAPNNRGLVFEPNLGIAKLSGSLGTLKVTHDLYSQDAKMPPGHAANTKHSIDFEATDDIQPELST